MESDSALRSICDDVARLYLGLPSTSWSDRAGARAIRELTDALHLASGRPHDTHWLTAVESVRELLDLCEGLPRIDESPAFRSLSLFVGENVDMVTQREKRRPYAPAFGVRSLANEELRAVLFR